MLDYLTSKIYNSFKFLTLKPQFIVHVWLYKQSVTLIINFKY